jgi:excisionase family DNA binding protein
VSGFFNAMRIRVLKTNSQIEPAYMGLRNLSAWSGIGLTKLREHIKSGDLPAFKVKGGSYLVKLKEFNLWMEQHRYKPDLNKLVDEVMEGL